MNVYEELKGLFNTKQDTWNLFYTLHHIMDINSEDVLYLFRRNKSKTEFINYLKRNKVQQFNPSTVAFWSSFNNTRTYLRTIEEVKRMHGFRFKNVYFMD